MQKEVAVHGAIRPTPIVSAGYNAGVKGGARVSVVPTRLRS